MASIEVIGEVQVSREPEAAKAVAWTGATVVVAGATAWGMLVGRYYMVIGFGLLAFTIASTRRALASHETRAVAVSLQALDGVLRIEMKGSRLFDGRYVDQCYILALSDLDYAGASASGTFAIRARKLESFAVDEGRVLDRRTHDFTEVSFKTDLDSCGKLENFMASARIAELPAMR